MNRPVVKNTEGGILSYGPYATKDQASCEATASGTTNDVGLRTNKIVVLSCVGWPSHTYTRQLSVSQQITVCAPARERSTYQWELVRVMGDRAEVRKCAQ